MSWLEIDKEIIKMNNTDCFFEDNFECSLNHSDLIDRSTNQMDNQNSVDKIVQSSVSSIVSNDEGFVNLSDSEDYIRSLERKLDKVKGTNSKSAKQSKDLIESLASVRQDTIRNFLVNEPVINENQEDNVDETITSSNLEKKIHPERQALTTRELDHLLKADYLAKKTEQ